METVFDTYTASEVSEAAIQGEVSESKPTKEINISPEAKAQLLEWNITEEQIEGIQRLMEESGSESSIEKAQRIAENPPVIIQGLTFHTIAINKFHDIVNHSDQNSADQTKKLLVDLSNKYLLQKIISNGQLQFRICEGKSDKFFTESRHVWLELSNKNNPDVKINIDPTFRKIENAKESTNTLTTIYEPNPISLFNYDAEIVITTSKDELLHNPQIAKGETRTKTLGFSEDKRLIYSLGYYRESGTSKPFIRITDESGKSESLVALDSDKLEFISDKIESIKATNLEEITNILKTLEKAVIVDKSQTITEQKILKNKSTIIL